MELSRSLTTPRCASQVLQIDRKSHRWKRRLIKTSNSQAGRMPVNWKFKMPPGLSAPGGLGFPLCALGNSEEMLRAVSRTLPKSQGWGAGQQQRNVLPASFSGSEWERKWQASAFRRRRD